MEDSTNQSVPLRTKMEAFSAYIIAGLALLVPIFFIPNVLFPLEFSKALLALAGVVLVLVLFSVQALRKGSVSLLWSRLLIALFILPVAYLVAGIFSPVPAVSLFGYQLDQDTFGFIALAVALSMATVLVIRSEKSIFSVLTGVLIAGWAALVFQSIQLLFKAPILSNLFTSSAANSIGSWSDFALFIGLIASLVLLALETLTLSNFIRGVLFATLALSVGVLAVANFSLVWYLLGGIAFILFLLAFTRRTATAAHPVSRTRGITSCVVLVIAVFFAFFGSGLGTALQTHFGVQALEVRPSVQSTLGVMEHVYTTNAFFGAGPNLFSESWLASRSQQILATPFWNTEFTAGFGYIPTALVTGGIVVGFAWLLLLVLFLYTAVRALLTASASGKSYFLIAATVLGVLFLFIAHVFYVPSQGLTLLLFLFLGLFVASLRGSTLARPVGITFSESPRLGFLSVLVIAVALVASLVSLYGIGSIYASSVKEGQAVVKANAGDIDGALLYANAAIALSPQDRYYRTLTALDLAHLNTLVQKGGSGLQAQTDFQTGLSAAITASQAAVAANPLNFDNWMSKASVYEAVVPLNISGALENAVTAFQQAGKLNPGTPEVDYHLATLAAYKNDAAGARTSAQSALTKKADYTPAILLLAQLSLNEGKIEDAITAVKAAIVFNPQNSSLLYQLGLLQLSAKHYQDASDSFNAALAITPNYANASFFLGQADVFLNKNDEALAIFKDLETKNAGNATLESVITALEKGQNPFTAGTTVPPIDTTAAPAQ